MRIAVIGGGIGGATAACHLAPDHEVVLLEQESELAFHTTGRSAAVFMEGDTGPVMQPLALGARSFFEADHPELDAPLLEPMPALMIGSDAERDQLLAQAKVDSQLQPAIRFIEGDELVEWCPVLRPDVITCGVIEPTAASIDVMATHQLYVRRAVANGAEIRRSAKVTGCEKLDHGWRLATAAGPVDCDLVVNAAGAWGDEIARLADVEPVGLTPMRRTAFTTRVGRDPMGWPLAYSVVAGRSCYFKPEAGSQLLCSLADETPSSPDNARPEEIDVARAIDNINALSTLDIRSVATTWAGQRTFAPDRNPVFGFDDAVDGFFWMVGQGGWGIISSPSAGRIAAALIGGRPLPEDLVNGGLTVADLAPRRGGNDMTERQPNGDEVRRPGS